MSKQLAQPYGATDRHVGGADECRELAVANPTFLLERLGSECTDLQGLRELTVNGLDAIAALGADTGGRVVWDLDWERFDASDGRVRKLSVIDTGTGMTAGQLRHYINQLAASGREQSLTGNFGVGAKVAAGFRNPQGLEYRSWHQGEGSLVCFKRHPDGRWGLEPQRWADGRSDYWRPLGEAQKPWLLRGQDHGTQVVLLGQHERHDTTQAPQSVTEARRQWITRYLNGRFLRLPERVEVLVREDLGRGEPGQLRRICGERNHLERHAVAAGAVQLSDAVAHWWVLDDGHRRRRREAVLWASTGHAAAAFADELYDVLPQTRGGYGRLQDFGIRFGYERVVLHLEPHVQTGRLERNTARTVLLLDHEPLPWSRWGEEFAAKMPDEVLRLQERAASADCLPRQEAIRSRVTAILPLYRLSRYRPPRSPRPPSRKPATGSTEHEAGSPQTGKSAPPSDEPVTHPTRASLDGGRGRGPAGDESPPIDADHEARSLTSVDLPDVAWISARDGTRAPGDLEDQAARYHPSRHELTINSDFRAISDLITQWCRRYEGVPGVRTVIEATSANGANRSSSRSCSPSATRTGTRNGWKRSSHRRRSPPPYCRDTCSMPRSRSGSRRNSGHREANELDPRRAGASRGAVKPGRESSASPTRAIRNGGRTPHGQSIGRERGRRCREADVHVPERLDGLAASDTPWLHPVVIDAVARRMLELVRESDPRTGVDPPDLLTVAEVADRLKMTRNGSMPISAASG